MRHEELQYLELVQEVMRSSTDRKDRTGIGTKSVFGTHMRFDLSKGFPLFTTRFISFRIAFEEMMFFLRGETNSKDLESKGINIWKENTSREFLDQNGLYHLPEGEMGKGYGWQIRNFGGDEDRDGFDQLYYLIHNIKKNPNDRRHYINYWNPNQVLNEAALPPCHLSYNCQIENDKLNACFYMRSSDLYHGAPYNIAGYAYFTCWLSMLTGYKPGVLVMFAADTHLYNSQFEVAEELVKRKPKPFPQLKFKEKFSTLEDGLNISYEDISLVGYEHCGRLKKVKMAV